MIKASEIVLNVLSQGLQASGVNGERGLRLKEEGYRLTLELDTPNKLDRVILHDDRTVLIIAPALEARIGDAFIDAEVTADGPELVLRSTG